MEDLSPTQLFLLIMGAVLAANLATLWFVSSWRDYQKLERKGEEKTAHGKALVALAGIAMPAVFILLTMAVFGFFGDLSRFD